MPWTVKNDDGALDFQTLADVERAFRMGLVEPDDLLQEHGKNTWRRAGDHPVLQSSAPKKRALLSMPKPVLLGTVLAVGLALVAFVLIARGQWAMGLAVAAAVSLFLFRFNRRVMTSRAATPPPTLRRRLRST